VKLKTTPDKMVDQIEGNIDKLKLGMSLRVKDLEIPEGIEVLNYPNTPVCLVEIPRLAKLDEEEEEEELAEGAEAPEGEESADSSE
jgi:large subunit ribosomal protein L25